MQYNYNSTGWLIHVSLIDTSPLFRGENTVLYFDKMVHHARFRFAVIGERKIYRAFALSTRVYIFHPVMYTFEGTSRIITRNTLRQLRLREINCSRE